MGSMAFRSFIKSLMPPIVTDFRAGGRLLPSWQAAAAASAGYEDETLNSFRVKRAAQRKADGSLLPTNMLHLTALAMGKPEIAVTDFGGSTGDLGRDFLSVFPKATYTVVENPTMVNMMRHQGGLRFSQTIPAACDIFFTSGTLQYLEDPVSVMNQGFASAGFAVILARNSFCDVDLFRVQRSKLFNNGSGDVPDGYSNVTISYPHRTLKESTVHKIAESHGLRCIARTEDRSGVIPYRGLVYGQQLVFLRAQRG
jgi:putative methyltransferase (TIGR04325 family)